MIHSNHMDKNNIEILAPVGSMQSVPAAVLNGADAIYLGLEAFSARQNAKNFTAAELIDTVKYCHIRGVKVYLAINTVVFDESIDRLTDTLKVACEAGVDGLIVQDLAVFSLVKECCPNMPIHASTQMTVHTVAGAKMLKELGASRAVLAREMSLREIRKIITEVQIETEVFVHGALCMCVSGQCYMSSAIGSRSGNKGSCAGSCRLPFGVNTPNDYDLSLKDLCLAGHFDELKKLGVTSLKIEGRMKRPEYVAATVKAYSGLKNGIMPDIDMLRAVFSRNGFTDGYFASRINADMFGVRGKDDVTALTEDVLSDLQKTYQKETHTIPINMAFSLDDNLARLRVWDNNGHKTASETTAVQTAINLPLGYESAKQSLSKIGATPFYLDEFTADIKEGLMLPKSELNALRRKACEELADKIAYKEKISFTEPKKASHLTEKKVKKALRARFLTVSQIPFECLEAFEYIYLPVLEVKNNIEILDSIKQKIILEPDRIMFDSEEDTIKTLKELRQQGFENMCVSNPAHIFIGNKLEFKLFGTAFLNITNSLSLNAYSELGISDTALSFECTAGQINHMDNSKTSLGAIVYGYLPLMIVRNCPVKRHRSCKDCNGESVLCDRLGNKFRVICNNRRYSEILNCKKLYLADKLNAFISIDYGVLYFTVEKKSECKQITESFLSNSAPTGDFTRGLYFRGIE